MSNAKEIFHNCNVPYDFCTGARIACYSIFTRFVFKCSAYRRTDETNSFRVKMKLSKKSKILPPLSDKQKIKHVTRGRPFSKKKKRPKTIPSFRGKGTLRPEGIGFFHGMECVLCAI